MADGRLPGGDNVLRNLFVLLGGLRRQGGVTKPTLFPRLRVSRRSHGEKTQEQKAYCVTSAHRFILKSIQGIKLWPSTLELLPAPRKAPLFAIAPSARKARSCSGRMNIPRSRCTRTRWETT